MPRHQVDVLTGLSAQRDRRHKVVERPAGVKGAFRITLADGGWWWSPGMFTLHGYQAELLPRIVPTTRTVLQQVHPDDRSALFDAWTHLIADGRLVALHYRIIGADDIIRPVFVLASTDFNSAHPPTAVTGVMEFEEPRRSVNHPR